MREMTASSTVPTPSLSPPILPVDSISSPWPRRSSPRAPPRVLRSARAAPPHVCFRRRHVIRRRVGRHATAADASSSIPKRRRPSVMCFDVDMLYTTSRGCCRRRDLSSSSRRRTSLCAARWWRSRWICRRGRGPHHPRAPGFGRRLLVDLGGVGHVLEEHDGEMAVALACGRMAGRWGEGFVRVRRTRGGERRWPVPRPARVVALARRGRALELQRQGFGHGDLFTLGARSAAPASTRAVERDEGSTTSVAPREGARRRRLVRRRAHISSPACRFPDRAVAPSRLAPQTLRAWVSASDGFEMPPKTRSTPRRGKAVAAAAHLRPPPRVEPRPHPREASPSCPPVGISRGRRRRAPSTPSRRPPPR